MERDEIDALEQAVVVLARVARRGLLLAEDVAEDLLRLLDLADLAGLVLDGETAEATSR